VKTPRECRAPKVRKSWWELQNVSKKRRKSEEQANLNILGTHMKSGVRFDSWDARTSERHRLRLEVG
jgi:hypothetical protein